MGKVDVGGSPMPCLAIAIQSRDAGIRAGGYRYGGMLSRTWLGSLAGDWISGHEA